MVSQAALELPWLEAWMVVSNELSGILPSCAFANKLSLAEGVLGNLGGGAL